jgi:hypothetical protein
MQNSAPFEFLDRALRCDPGVHIIVMTADYTRPRVGGATPQRPRIPRYCRQKPRHA